MSYFTEEQKERFVQHLITCHSWYKHLSLVNGGSFLMTIDENAGINYPLQHPKLPFGNTSKGYQKAFGQLTYFYSISNDSNYHSDWQSGSYSEHEIMRKYQQIIKIQVYPYLSYDFCEAIDFHKLDFDKIILKKEHEEAEKLQKILHLDNYLNEYWQNRLNDEERNTLCNEETEKYNVEISEYLLIQQELNTCLTYIQQKEILKIKIAIEKIENGPPT